MKTAIALLSSCVLAPLSACGTSNIETLNGFIQIGDCSSASNFVSNTYSGIEFYHQSARIDFECRENEARAAQLFDLTARYGHEESKRYLNIMNEEAPEENPRPIPRVSVSNPSPLIPNRRQNSSVDSNIPEANNRNRYLVDIEPVVGGALCTYSDGTTSRISGSSNCPRRN